MPDPPGKHFPLNGLGVVDRNGDGEITSYSPSTDASGREFAVRTHSMTIRPGNHPGTHLSL